MERLTLQTVCQHQEMTKNSIDFPVGLGIDVVSSEVEQEGGQIQNGCSVGFLEGNLRQESKHQTQMVLLSEKWHI